MRQLGLRDIDVYAANMPVMVPCGGTSALISFETFLAMLESGFSIIL